MSMAARDSKAKLMVALMLIKFSLFLGAHAAQEWGRLSKEENLELERQLKIINKPPIKSFRTKYGDILDCVDIYKQLAFDHPLLKNHTVQMKPKTVPKDIRDKASIKGKSSRFLPKNIKCPKGSVIIRRTAKEDLIMANNLRSLRLSRLNQKWGTRSKGYSAAVLLYQNEVYGATSAINVWNCSVTAEQFSISSLWIANGVEKQIDSIQAGWIVDKFLFKNYTRLFAYWAADGSRYTGCFNVLCAGFVQVSSDIPLGIVLKPASTYGGSQFNIEVNMLLDPDVGAWWLVVNKNNIGYWPIQLFTDMSDRASIVAWGGEVYSTPEEPSPPMGSGLFPSEGYKEAAYISDVQVAVDGSGRYVVPDEEHRGISVDTPECYDAKVYGGDFDDSKTILFGGPGKCTLA